MELTTDRTPSAKNLRGALFPLAQGVVSLASGDVGGAMGSFREAFESYTEERLTSDQLAYRLWCETFSLALAEALRRCNITILQTKEEQAQAIAEYLEQSFDDGAGFGEGALVEPAGFEGYRKVRERFPDFLRRIDPELQEGNPETWRGVLDDCLRSALVQAWSGDLDRYGTITDRFEGPVAEGARRQASWMRHYGWIRQKFEQDPVFSPDEADLGIKLKDVYVRLRCCRHEVIKADESDCEDIDPNSAQQKSRRVAHLNYLHDEMNAWLAAPEDRRDLMRLVAGGPGSGKSSFAKALACETIAANRWRVIFVELQHMRLDGDLQDALERHLTRRTALGFHQDPLGWRREDGRPHLLVFDGLDELARSEDRATDLTRRFVDNLHRLLQSIRSEDRPIRAVVLGRSAAAEEGRKVAELTPGSLLHVLPLRPPTRRDLGLEEKHRSSSEDGLDSTADDVNDPFDLLASEQADQRPLYWQRWQQAHGEDGSEVPEGVTHNDLADLNAEPLLLHLLIISGYMTPDRWGDAADNRNVVYEAIFEKVFERDKSKASWTAAKLDRADFFTLMECLGLASWAGSGRTGNDQDFKRLRAGHASNRQEKRFETLRNADLKGAALQFYTRQELDADTGFEFIHKSFGEYLIARALLPGRGGSLGTRRQARKLWPQPGSTSAAWHRSPTRSGASCGTRRAACRSKRRQARRSLWKRS